MHRVREAVVLLAAVVEGALYREVTEEGRASAHGRRMGDGLVPMRERAAEFEGAFALEAGQAHGTRVLPRDVALGRRRP